MDIGNCHLPILTDIYIIFRRSANVCFKACVRHGIFLLIQIISIYNRYLHLFIIFLFFLNNLVYLYKYLLKLSLTRKFKATRPRDAVTACATTAAAKKALSGSRLCASLASSRALAQAPHSKGKHTTLTANSILEIINNFNIFTWRSLSSWAERMVSSVEVNLNGKASSVVWRRIPYTRTYFKKPLNQKSWLGLNRFVKRRMKTFGEAVAKIFLRKQEVSQWNAFMSKYLCDEGHAEKFSVKRGWWTPHIVPLVDRISNPAVLYYIIWVTNTPLFCLFKIKRNLSFFLRDVAQNIIYWP